VSGKGEWWNDPANDVPPREGKRAGTDVETLERFGHLLVAELQERVTDVPVLPLIVLRLMLQELFDDMLFKEADMLYTARGWDIDDAVRGPGLAIDFERRCNAADGRALGKLLAVALVVPDGTSGLGPAELRAGKSPAVALAGYFGIDLDRVLRDAQICVRAVRGRGDESVAGAARQGLDMTAAFIAQHGTAAGGADVAADTTTAGNADEVNDEGASDAH
jgi:hypothetical protein